MPNKPSTLQIFIDLDGVLADFVGGALKVFNRPDLLKTWPKGTYDICTLLKLEPRAFWREINTYDFWFNLDLTPEAKDIVRLCKQYGECYILTAPSDHYCSLQGKLYWVSVHFPDLRHNIIFCPAKHKALLNRGNGYSTHFLIEDNMQTYADWNSQQDDPQNAYLIPRPWNDKPEEDVLTALKLKLENCHY